MGSAESAIKPTRGEPPRRSVSDKAAPLTMGPSYCSGIALVAPKVARFLRAQCAYAANEPQALRDGARNPSGGWHGPRLTIQSGQFCVQSAQRRETSCSMSNVCSVSVYVRHSKLLPALKFKRNHTGDCASSAMQSEAKRHADSAATPRPALEPLQTALAHSDHHSDQIRARICNFEFARAKATARPNRNSETVWTSKLVRAPRARAKLMESTNCARSQRVQPAFGFRAHSQAVRSVSVLIISIRLLLHHREPRLNITCARLDSILCFSGTRQVKRRLAVRVDVLPPGEFSATLSIP